MIKGSVADVRPGDEVVFCDIVDGVEVQAKGLAHFVHIERPGQNIFIFDNHNHAFSFWAVGLRARAIALGSTLVHVDQHKDTRKPDREAPVSTFEFGMCPLKAYFEYANDILNVGNFIPPALELGWFKDVLQVQELGDTHLIQKELNVCHPILLDIDLDIFAPIMAHIPDEIKIARLREWIICAPFVTIATSPFFMDQEKAVELVKELL